MPVTRVEMMLGHRTGEARVWTQRYRAALCSMVAGMMVWPIAAVSAQIAYRVFPAKSLNAGAIVQPTNPDQPRVTLAVRDSTIEFVVNAIARQAHVRPVYDNSNPLFAKRIAIRLKHVLLRDALAAALRGTGLVAKLTPDGETVMIRAQVEKSPEARDSLAGGVVTGKITDSASGQGLGGASIKVAGTKFTSVTSDSGNFTITRVLPGDQVLSIRLFGYRPVERTVTVIDGQRTTVRIVVARVPTVLSGVVTTATGKQRRIEMGNDVTSLNVDSIMRVTPVMNVTDLLETRVPGLTITHSSGEPGAPSRLRLRGIGSISGNNDPIIIIDGIRSYSSQSDPRNNNLAPAAKYASTGAQDRTEKTRTQFVAASPIDQIDPGSIETIEVFKGPSASALYGSDAANGVIVITTKRGRAGPTHWSLDVGQGVNWIPGNWPTNYFRFGYNVNGNGPVCNWYDPTCVTIDSVRTFQALNDPQYTLLSHGSDQTAMLSISGGVPTLQYNLSGNAAGQVGNLKLPEIEQRNYAAAYGSIPHWMVRPDNYSTWGGSGALTVTPSPKIQIVLQSRLFSSKQQTSSLSGALPQVEGIYISNGVVTDYEGNSAPLTSQPLVDRYVERITADQLTSGNTLMLSWAPRAWLPITASGGIETIQRTDHAYVPYGVSVAGPDGCGVDARCLADTSGYYGLGRGVSNNTTLNVRTTLPLLHNVVALAVGGNYYAQTTNDFQAFTEYLAPGVSIPPSFLTQGCYNNFTCSATQSSTQGATYGWYVEPQFRVASRFFVSPGFRLDGGSGGTHATSTGSATGGVSAFPKVDLSYVAIDRQGSQPLWGFLTLFRPRFAFGIAGTQPAPEDRLRLFNLGTGYTLNPGGEGNLVGNADCTAGLSLNGETVPGVCLASLGNTDLRPERSSELEGGFEAAFWNGRLAMTYTQYNRTRKDAIISIPVAPSVSMQGGSAFNVSENIGEVRNTGTELSVNATVFERRAFSWDIGANLSNNNNLLVHLNPGQSPNYILGLVPGYPLFGQWRYPILSFSDQNHDGIIEGKEIFLGDSLSYQGQPNPKYQLNLNTGIHLLNGRLSVNATFAYQNGMTQNNQAALQSASFYTLGNNPTAPLAYQAAVVAATCVSNPNIGCGLSTTTSDGLLQTVNTFRFSDLSVNYELPQVVSSWFHVPRAAVALQGSNLALHTNYRGKDPDVNAFSTVSSVDETADLGQIPEPRIWWLKLTLGN